MLIQAASTADFKRLTEIWEAAVRATHAFLTEADIADIKTQVEGLWATVPPPLLFRLADGRIAGFMGLEVVCPSRAKIEMLFVDPAHHGQGVGGALIDYAKTRYARLELDVNEQNPKARAFYEKRGFVLIGRSDKDSQGRPFPLLHMRWLSEN